MSGSKWARYFTFELVSDIAAWVRPWKPPRNAMTTGPPGCGLGELDRGLDRLGARVGQEQADLGVRRAVREALGQASMQLEPGLVVDDVLLEVEPARRLLGDCRDHPRMSVAGVGDPDAAGVVEVALAIDRLDPRAGRALHHEVGVSGPHRWHAGAQCRPIGQKVGGVLIHSRRVSPLASLRQRCGMVDGKVRASPASDSRYVSSSPTQTVTAPESR